MGKKLVEVFCEVTLNPQIEEIWLTAKPFVGQLILTFPYYWHEFYHMLWIKLLIPSLWSQRRRNIWRWWQFDSKMLFPRQFLSMLMSRMTREEFLVTKEQYSSSDRMLKLPSSFNSSKLKKPSRPRTPLSRYVGENFLVLRERWTESSRGHCLDIAVNIAPFPITELL